MGLQLSKALSLVLKTKPYIVYRTAMHGALCLAVIVYLAMLALIGAVFGAGAFWAVLVASIVLTVLLGIGGFVAEYLFHRLKAGHVALFTEIVTEGGFPSGISQTKWVRGRVNHYFSGMGPLAQVRQILRGALRTMNHTLFDSSAVLPMPGLEGRMKCAQRLVDLSQEYIEEAILAHAFKSRDGNVVDALRAGLVVYCHCWKSILSNAVMLTLLGYAFALIAAVVCLVPLGALALLVPPSWQVLRFTLFAVGLFMGFSAKWAFFDPLASASTILAFLEESDVVAPDPEWEARLDLEVKEFSELRSVGRAPKAGTGHEAAAGEDSVP